MVNGTNAGSSRTAQGFTFTRVASAGHMVPMNQPEAALDLLARVISGAPFDSNPSNAVEQAELAQETAEQLPAQELAQPAVAAPAIALS